MLFVNQANFFFKFFEKKKNKFLKKINNIKCCEYLDKNSKKIKIQEIKNYTKFLPVSFIEDKASPFFASVLWLQRLGRSDLIENSFEVEKNFKIIFNSKINFKFDPTFQISKKKKKIHKITPIICIGNSQEEKIMVFTNQKKNQLFNSIDNFKKIEKYGQKKIRNKILFNSFVNIIEFKFCNLSKIDKLLFSIYLFFFSLFLKF